MAQDRCARRRALAARDLDVLVDAFRQSPSSSSYIAAIRCRLRRSRSMISVAQWFAVVFLVPLRPLLRARLCECVESRPCLAPMIGLHVGWFWQPFGAGVNSLGRRLLTDPVTSWARGT